SRRGRAAGQPDGHELRRPALPRRDGRRGGAEQERARRERAGRHGLREAEPEGHPAGEAGPPRVVRHRPGSPHPHPLRPTRTRLHPLPRRVGVVLREGDLLLLIEGGRTPTARSGVPSPTPPTLRSGFAKTTRRPAGWRAPDPGGTRATTLSVVPR